MTIAVDLGRKATKTNKQTNKQINPLWIFNRYKRSKAQTVGIHRKGPFGNKIVKIF